jgi:ketosteroid isomerase-like protein
VTLRATLADEMSAENVELIRSILPEEADLVEALASGDPAGFFVGDAEVVSPELEVEFTGAVSGGTGGQFRGTEGLLEGWRDWLEPWDSYRIHFDEVIDAGENVVTFATVRARTSRYGVEVEHAPAAVWTIRDGNLVAVTFFLERDKALKFAGLDQQP